MLIATGSLLLLALLSTILAISIRSFEGICDPEDVIANFGDAPPRDADFLDDRIVDLAVATNRNASQNNQTAQYLRAAIILLFLGVLLHVAIFFVAAMQ